MSNCEDSLRKCEAKLIAHGEPMLPEHRLAALSLMIPDEMDKMFSFSHQSDSYETRITRMYAYLAHERSKSETKQFQAQASNHAMEIDAIQQ